MKRKDSDCAQSNPALSPPPLRPLCLCVGLGNLDPRSMRCWLATPPPVACSRARRAPASMTSCNRGSTSSARVANHVLARDGQREARARRLGVRPNSTPQEAPVGAAVAAQHALVEHGKRPHSAGHRARGGRSESRHEVAVRAHGSPVEIRGGGVRPAASKRRYDSSSSTSSILVAEVGASEGFAARSFQHSGPRESGAAPIGVPARAQDPHHGIGGNGHDSLSTRAGAR